LVERLFSEHSHALEDEDEDDNTSAVEEDAESTAAAHVDDVHRIVEGRPLPVNRLLSMLF
jgi:hypothetical protein